MMCLGVKSVELLIFVTCYEEKSVYEMMAKMHKSTRLECENAYLLVSMIRAFIVMIP